MTTHTFYKAVFDVPEFAVLVSWHETHDEASRATFRVSNCNYVCEQVMKVEVPTEKAALMKWLNDNCCTEV